MRLAAPPERASARGRKALWLALGLGLALGLWWWLTSVVPRRAAGDSPLAGGGGPATAGADEPRPSGTLRSLPAVPPPAPPPAPPIVDEVTVEKPEVCEGEENLVTVRAHTPDNNDAFLHYVIGPARGSRVPLRSFLDDRGGAPTHRIIVFSRHNVATSMDVPVYRVKRCDDLTVAVVEHRLLPNSWAEFEFEARVMAAVPSRGGVAGGAPFRPKHFRWSFGDGVSVESGASTVTHSFADRPQETLYSSFVAAVEVVSDDGRVARARQSVELLNPAFEAFAAKGIVQLMVELHPRFPVLAPGGLVEQEVRIWHVRPASVAITSVTVTRRQAGDQRSPRREHPPVTAVLGARDIPPGRGLRLRVVLDTTREPDVLSHDYDLQGLSADGAPVRGSFSVMRPPRPPTRDRHHPVVDPVLTARIKRARELLQAEVVTDEDLWALERAGKFHDLPPAPPSAAGPPVSPARPSAAGGR